MVLAHAFPSDGKQIKLAPGLADPVHDSQGIFTALMQAMARPGRVFDLDILPAAPEPLLPTTGAVLLAMADYDTTVWLDVSDDRSEAAIDWLSFHTGAPSATDRARSDFAIITNCDGLRDFDGFALGASEYPDRSTTLLLQVDALEETGSFHLTGPGIETYHRLGVTSLPRNFTGIWTRNHALFPLGIDIILCAPDRIACLPRTVTVTEAD